MKQGIFFILSAVCVFSICCTDTKSATEPITESITGVWVHKHLADSIGLDDFYEMKIITGNSFSVLQKSPENPFFTLFFQGTYELTDSTYIEKIEYQIGKAGSPEITYLFKSEIKDGLWYINGQNNPYNQVWRRKIY